MNIKLETKIKAAIKVAENRTSGGLGVIPEEILNYCYRIPESGIKTISELLKDPTYFPHPHSDEGKYSFNNSHLIFVHPSGTYVATGLAMLDLVRACSYQEASFWVPFSNGEKIPMFH